MAYYSSQSYGTQIIYDELTTHIPVACSGGALEPPANSEEKKIVLNQADFKTISITSAPSLHKNFNHPLPTENISCMDMLGAYKRRIHDLNTHNYFDWRKDTIADVGEITEITFPNT